jgi:hypothetical protein
VVRFLAAVALVVSVAGCQTAAVATPSPSPVAAIHAVVAQTVLQATDIPAGLTPCASSGTFGSYIAAVKAADPEVAATIASQWKALQAQGAGQAEISLFAADPSACTAELGASGSVKAAASLVVAFGDEGGAERAWEQGVLGFAPPAPGEAPPGIVRGVATGLGASSWTYYRGPVRLACWRKSVFVALVVFTNLDPASFKAAAAAVDARLN